jgi:hypothetical protein
MVDRATIGKTTSKPFKGCHAINKTESLFQTVYDLIGTFHWGESLLIAWVSSTLSTILVLEGGSDEKLTCMESLFQEHKNNSWLLSIFMHGIML